MIRTAFPFIGLDTEVSVSFFILFFFFLELSYQNETAALIFLINRMMQDFILNTLNLKQINKNVFPASIVRTAGKWRRSQKTVFETQN